jgi:hypothetical protein
MPKVIVPVGFDAGPVWPLESASEPEYYEVLVGDGSVELPEDVYLVWGTTMIDRPAHADVRFTKDDLVRLTSDDSRIADPQGAIQRLVDGGLLAEYDPAEPSEFLRAYKLHLLAEGSGNTQEHPEMFRLGRAGQILLELYHDAYAMLLGMPYASNMSEEIESYSKMTPAEGSFNLGELSEMFARTVPAVVSTRCGYLQPS